MRIDKPKLEIFHGSEAPDTFVDDLETFLKLEDDLKKEVIRNTFAWYPVREIDEEWNEWMDKRSDEEKERLKDALRVVIFVMKTGLMKRFTDEYFVQELKKMHFDSSLIDLFLSELRKRKEDLVQEIETTEVPVVSRLTNLNWRIDLKRSSTYSRRIDEVCVLLNISLTGPENHGILFELSSGELNSVIRTLSLIQQEIGAFELEEKQ